MSSIRRQGLFVLALSFLFFSILSGCDRSGNNTQNTNNENNVNNVDPCREVNCGTNAHCDPDLGTCVCDPGYGPVGDDCTDTRMVECVDDSPENASPVIITVAVSWHDETGWEAPEPCAWTCDAGHTRYQDACVAIPEVPLDGFGMIFGDCGVLNEPELAGPDPVFFANVLDFADDVYDAEDFQYLTEGGQVLATSANAGGSSGWSEVFAFEMLARCELADLLKTETEIIYDTEGKITDILVWVDNWKIGVSVVRAMTYPRTDPPDPEAIRTLIERKLADILLSTQNVSAQDRWVKQILSVLADTDLHGETVRLAWEQIDPAIRADTILYVTVTEGADDPIYTNQI